MNGQKQYAAPRDLTSRATRPANADDTVRLRTFRHELRAVGPEPDRTALLRLLDRARQLGLEDEQILPELRDIQVSLDAIDFSEELSSDGLPVVPSIERLPAGQCCHFTAPVHCGRRRNDRLGHIELTSSWLRFHGALDLSIVWSEVESVARDGRDIVVSLVGRRRRLRFCCHSSDEAARGAATARHLLSSARGYR